MVELMVLIAAAVVVQSVERALPFESPELD